MNKNALTNADLKGLDELINMALDGYKNGTLSRDKARGSLAQVISALDCGNYGEVRHWFENPEKLYE